MGYWYGGAGTACGEFRYGNVRRDSVGRMGGGQAVGLSAVKLTGRRSLGRPSTLWPTLDVCRLGPRSVWTVDVHLGPTVAMPAPPFLAELRRSRVLDGLVVSLGRGKAVGLGDIVYDGQEFTHGAEVLG